MKPLPIRHHLALLVLVTAAPLLLFTVALVLWHSQTEQELLRQQATRSADAAMQSVDREVSAAIAGLQVLAASPALAAGDLRSFHEQAKGATGIAGNSVIILYDRGGKRHLSTAVPFGQPLAPRLDMAALAVPFDTGRPHVTPLFLSETVKRPTVGIMVPVIVDEQVRYVLGAGLLSDRLGALLTSSGVSAAWPTALIDRDGTIIARTTRAVDVVGMKALPENWRRIGKLGTPGGTFEGTTREGAPAFIGFARSGSSGWTTAVAVPLSTLRGDLHTSLSIVAALGVAVLLVALLLAWWAAKHISWPTNQLEAAAKAMEDGDFVEMQSTGIAQFDHLAGSMRAAAHTIRERETRLSHSLEELRQAHAQLRAEQAKKDEFIATLAHELRNPLAPIRTGLHVLGKSPPPAVAARTLATMERQLSHVVRLIDDLLDVSRIARGKLVLQQEDVVLQQVISHAVDESEPFLKAGGQQFSVAVPPEPIWVHADATRMVQVLTNLLNNAAKFTPAAGSITLTATSDGRMAEIRVTDTGIGIPPERLQDVFELFTQVKGAQPTGQPGLGIGLSLARMLVDLHGGTIEAHSDGPDRGACVAIRLPVCRHQDDSAPVPALRHSSGTGALRVLLADDNIDAAEMLATTLRLSGHSAYVAHDGPAALKLARECDADLVVLDIGMPGLDGYEVCRRLRQMPAYAGRRIVALTGWGAPADRQMARDAGFDAHLTKPVDWNQLQEIVDGAAMATRADQAVPAL